MDLLAGWYPGLGEVELIRRMCPLVQDFLRDAVEEDPDFLSEYVIPTLQGYEDPEEKILSDLSDAAMALELSDAGLGSYEENLGNLGKSFLKKVAKVVRKVHAPLRKLEKKVVRGVEKVGRKVGKAVSKAWQKYGNIFLQVVGGILAPFTGGASLAIASALTAANTYYTKKRAADRAKQAASRDAGQLTAEADQGRAEAEQRMNAFYSEHQQWFIDNLGMTPDKWAQLTFEQKVELLRNAAQGRPPSGTPVEPPADTSAPPTGGWPNAPGGGISPPSGGWGGGSGAPPAPGGGGGGGGYPEGTSSSGFTPYGQQQGRPEVAQAGMFSGNAIPLLAAGVALALVFGKSAKGGRVRRNPKRRYRRAVA